MCLNSKPESCTKWFAVGSKNWLAAYKTIKYLHAQAHGLPMGQGAPIYTLSKD